MFKNIESNVNEKNTKKRWYFIGLQKNMLNFVTIHWFR